MTDFLNGKTLRIASTDLPPFAQLLLDDNQRVVGTKGFCFEILNALMEAYNFSITIKVPEDKAYGAFENGVWNGMIAMILNNQTDFAIGSFTMTHVRYQAIDYTVPFYEESSGILIPATKREHQSSVFTQPFQLQVWMLLVAVLGLLPLVMRIQLSLIEQKISSQKKRKEKYVFVYGVLLNQSGQIHGRGSTFRFLATVWCLSSVVLIHAYVGTLMSYLSVPRLKPVIRSLDEVPSSGMGWYIWRGSDLESFFLEATDGIYNLIGNGLRKHPERMTYSIREGEQAVLNGSFVFMNALGSIKFAVQQDFVQSQKQCRLSVAKELFNKAHQAFILPKESPVRILINKKMLTMMEAGLMEYWREQYFSRNDFCSESQFYGRASKKLSFGDVQSAFIIWFIGACISLFAFITENSVFFIKSL